MPLSIPGQAVNDFGFVNRVTAAIVAAAINVSGEAVTSGKEVKYAKRQQLADRVLANPRGETDRFAWGVACNATISQTIDSNGTSDAVPDGDIEFTVASLWDDFAGVTNAEA